MQREILLCLAIAISFALELTQGLVCPEEGAIRLVGGRHPQEGRLEVCFSDSSQGGTVWGTVCNIGWDTADAQVACRQLGVSSENFSNIVSTAFFNGDQRLDTPIHWGNISCVGNETRLTDCPRGSNSCGSLMDISLICSQPNPECTSHDVRIVDELGNRATEGRVEFCRAGRWGTVCGAPSYWNYKDATVVCRQLGFNDNDSVAIQALATQPASDDVPINIDFTMCLGNESSLVNCPHARYIVGCDHSHDVGVKCTEECVEGSIRIGGSTPGEGRVEYCHNKAWSTVCKDNWDHHNAQVVCRQFGFTGVSLSQLDSSSNDMFTLTNKEFNCSGQESSLAQCAIMAPCLLGPGAGVKCFNESECSPDGSVSLRDGALSNEMGTVEVCYGQRGYVCDDKWDDTDAAIVCSDLGLTGGVAFPSSPFASAVGGFIMDDVECMGDEERLVDCPFRGFGANNCDQITQSSNPELRQAAVVCGTTRESQLDHCTVEQASNTISATEASITVGSFGVCELYQGLSSVCNAHIPDSAYVYLSGDKLNQTWLSYKLDEILSPALLDDGPCSTMMRSLVCNFFFAPCGVNSTVHIPRAVCSRECSLVQTTCERDWTRVFTVLRNIPALGAIDCQNTRSYLSPMPPVCCVGAGITIDPVTTDGGGTAAMPGADTGTVVAIVVSLLAVLLIIVVVVVLVVYLVRASRHRKKSFAKLHKELLSSPSRSSRYAGSFRLSDAVDTNNHGPIAVPNPYSKPDIEIEEEAMLTRHDSRMIKSISASLIRDLTSNLLIPHTRLKLQECVGQGEFGIVYKALYTLPEGEEGYKSDTIVAVKTLKGMFDRDQVNKIMEESLIMKKFDHPNVLNLVGVCLNAGHAPYVVMPYMANGSLLHYLKKERRNLVLPVGSDEDVRFEVCKRLVVMCMQISCGMEYLAHEKFVHRDLAARNCMIDIHFVIKIADFGLSEDVYAKDYFRQSDTDKNVKLPVKWMAPESLNDGLFSEKTDVWSFGITCWEVFSGGKTPYPGVDPHTLTQMLEADKRLSKPLNTACPSEMYQVMKHCWARDPNNRPTFSDILETISVYAEKIAGYLDINNYNPFYAEIKPLEADKNANNESKLKVELPPNLPKGSPKLSQRFQFGKTSSPKRRRQSLGTLGKNMTFSPSHKLSAESFI